MHSRETRRNWISPAKLIELLQSLPPEVDQVEINAIGNLMLTTEDGKYGWIDIHEEILELF
jgi:hypothetical protein